MLLVTLPVDYLLQVDILGPDCLVKGVDLSYLSFILFIAVIAGITQIVEMAVEKFSPSLYSALGIFCPDCSELCHYGCVFVYAATCNHGSCKYASHHQCLGFYCLCGRFWYRLDFGNC